MTTRKYNFSCTLPLDSIVVFDGFLWVIIVMTFKCITDVCSLSDQVAPMTVARLCVNIYSIHSPYWRICKREIYIKCFRSFENFGFLVLKSFHSFKHSFWHPHSNRMLWLDALTVTCSTNVFFAISMNFPTIFKNVCFGEVCIVSTRLVFIFIVWLKHLKIHKENNEGVEKRDCTVTKKLLKLGQVYDVFKVKKAERRSHECLLIERTATLKFSLYCCRQFSMYNLKKSMPLTIAQLFAKLMNVSSIWWPFVCHFLVQNINFEKHKSMTLKSIHSMPVRHQAIFIYISNHNPFLTSLYADKVAQINSHKNNISQWCWNSCIPFKIFSELCHLHSFFIILVQNLKIMQCLGANWKTTGARQCIAT